MQLNGIYHAFFRQNYCFFGAHKFSKKPVKLFIIVSNPAFKAYQDKKQRSVFANKIRLCFYDRVTKQMSSCNFVT